MERSETTNQLLENMAKEYRRIFGDSLINVYLYGSYARGDFDSESDIDIVGIINDEKLKKPLEDVSDDLIRYASNLGMEHDILISPSVILYSQFSKYSNALAYYRNILKEGIILNG